MFDIRKSTKAHIDSPEHFVVVRRNTVYLRIVGEEGAYTVMTATAGEDDGSFRAFGDQDALNEAALKVIGQMDLRSARKTDFHERPYVEICYCEYLSDAYRAAVIFFANLDAAEAPKASLEG
jgi:hypothetical protein